MSGIVKSCARFCVVATLVVMAGAALFASPAAATDGDVCRIATDSRTTAAEIMARPSGPCEQASRAASGTVWLDFGAPALLRGGVGRYRLLLDNHRVDSVDLYFRRVDGVIEHVAYDPASPTREWRSGGYFTVPVQLHGVPVNRLVVRLGGVKMITMSREPRLVEVTRYIALERKDSALFGMAVGMLALTILFHLSLFFAIRRRFQLLYCAHASVLLLYALSYSGLIMLAAPLSADAISRLICTSMAAATATGLLFSLDFIEGNVLPRWMRRWALVGAGLSILSATLLLLAPDDLTLVAYIFGNIVGLHALLLIAAVVATGCIRRSRTAWMLAAGWTVPFTIGMIFPLRFAGLVSSAILPDGAMVAACTIECLIVSLPVIERVKRLRLDHERVRERQQVLERQAATDALTGLSNRRGFIGAIERAVRLRGGEHPIALLMIDIDHFKALNDRYGHVRADAVLVDVGAHVGRAAGSGAIVARYGGEEFVVALVGLDQKRARTIAERIRRGIEARSDDLLSATVSIGVACGPCGAIDRLMVEADLALYDAKREGRNRVALSAASIDPAIAA